MLAAKVGPDAMPEITTAAFFTSHLPWFPIFRWFWLILFEILAVYGLTSILKRRKKLKAETDA